MALTSDADRLVGANDFMSEARDLAGVTFPYTKTDIRAAYNAADQWVSDNAASYNTALPTTFRNAATASEKARLLMHVIRVRFLKGV